MEIRYIKSPTTLLKRVYVNKEGLDLSKEILWVSLGQVQTQFACAGPISRIFFQPPILKPGIFAAL